MSVFVKIYAHHGWRYYLPLGVVKPEPVTVLPFTAAEYDNNCVWIDQLTGRNLLAYDDIEQTEGIYKIIDNQNALLLNSYRNDDNYPSDDSVNASGLFGNALTMRIKPGQFPDSSMLLCVLYSQKGRNSEKLMIAVKNYQLITYYMALNDEDNIRKTETGIYINDSDQWASIGFNFCSNADAGLAGVYVNGEYEEVNILPLQQFDQFRIFSLTNWEMSYYEDAKIYPFNGAVCDVQVFKSPLSGEEFGAILDKYDDSEDIGTPFTEFETGGELMKMFINVIAPEVPPNPGSGIGNGDNNGNDNNGNDNNGNNGNGNDNNGNDNNGNDNGGIGNGGIGNGGNNGDGNNVIYPPPPDPDSGDSGKERPLPNG